MSKKKTECVRCKRTEVIEGDILGHGDIGLGFVFRPVQLKWTTLIGKDITISKEAYACCHCGLIWQELNPKKLMRIVATKGSSKLKKQIDLSP